MDIGNQPATISGKHRPGTEQTEQRATNSLSPIQRQKIGPQSLPDSRRQSIRPQCHPTVVRDNKKLRKLLNDEVWINVEIKCVE